MKHILPILTLTVFAASCSKLTPAGFWTDYRSDLMTTKESDQGGWGGHRALHWRSEKANTFTSRELIDFAVENGWELAASARYVDGSLKIPLTTYIDDRVSLSILREKVLRQLTSHDNDILVFETGWIKYSPVAGATERNAEATERTGFVTISSNGTELSVYHLWGD